MATSKTQLCNLALSNIHHSSTIENVDTEQSTEALICLLWYDVARKQALADFNWSFARKRVTLVLHAEDPPAEWLYRYVRPEDCLAPRYIPNPIGADANVVPYEISQATDGSLCILTDVEDAEFVYTKDEKVTSRFSPHFDVALSYLLAVYLVGPIARKKTLKVENAKAYESMIQVAGGHDANQQPERAPLDASWIRDR